MAGPSSVVASLVVKMGLDPSGMAKGARQAEAQMTGLQKFAKSTIGQGLLQGVGLGGGMIATQAIAMGVQKAIEFTGDAINMASDLAETQSKLDVVFGRSAEAIRDWSETSSAGIITTESDLLAFASTMGNFALGMGESVDEAAAMSTRMVDLAADFASINNIAGGTNEVMGDFMSIMAGQTEVARRYAIDIGQAAIETELLKEGVKKVNGAWTEAQKFRARTNIIFDSRAAKIATGDVERTAKGFANMSRTLDKNLAELQTGFGELLMPIALNVVTVLTDVAGAIKDIADAIPEVQTALQDVADMPILKGTVLDRDWGNDAANFLRIVGTGGIAIATDAPNKIGDTFDDLIHGREIAENTVPKIGGLMGELRAAFDQPVPPPKIADPMADEFADTLGVIHDGFGSVKAALAKGGDRPQIISRDDRLENLQGRFRKAMKNLIAARTADDPWSEKFWQGGVDKTARLIAGLGGKVRPAMGKTTKAVNDGGKKAETDMKRHGRNIGKAVPDAVTAKVPAAGGAAHRMASAVQQPLASLPAQAMGWGLTTGSLYAQGLMSQVPQVAAAAAALAAAAAKPIKTESPPKYGPLREIDKWGAELVTVWTNPMLKKVPEVERVGEALGRALTPHLGRGGMDGPAGWDRASRAAVGALADGSVRSRREVHFHVGTLIANPAGLDELDRMTENRRRHRERGAGRRANDPN